LVRAIQDKGIRFELISFGISTSNELISLVDQFTEISLIPDIFRNGGCNSNERHPVVTAHFADLVRQGAN
jgi:uncharacterized LabA/DUF88 family protein